MARSSLASSTILASALLSSVVAARGEVSFSRQVGPLLAHSCGGCHKPGKLKGKLDLTSYEGLIRGGESGAVIQVDNPAESLLVRSVSGEKPEMPAQGERLSAGEIALLRAWISEGAKNDSAGTVVSTTVPPVYHSLPAVSALAFSPVEPLLAVGGYREVLIYRETGELAGRLVGTLPQIDSLAFAPDGKWLAAAVCEPSVRSEVQFWNVAEQRLDRAHTISSDSLFSLAFSPSGDRLVFGGADRIVRVLETASGKELVRFANHTDWVFGTVFSKDGQYIASAGRDSSLRVIEAASGRYISDLAPQNEAICALALNPAAPEVVYGGEKGGVRVYKFNAKEGFKDPGDNKLYVRDYDHLGAPVYSISYSPDGKWVAVAGKSSEVRIHQASDGKRVATLRGHRESIFATSFSANSQRLASAGSDGLVRVYDIPSGGLAASFPSVPLSPARARASIQ